MEILDSNLLCLVKKKSHIVTNRKRGKVNVKNRCLTAAAYFAEEIEQAVAPKQLRPPVNRNDEQYDDLVDKLCEIGDDETEFPGLPVNVQVQLQKETNPTVPNQQQSGSSISLEVPEELYIPSISPVQDKITKLRRSSRLKGKKTIVMSENDHRRLASWGCDPQYSITATPALKDHVSRTVYVRENSLFYGNQSFEGGDFIKAKVKHKRGYDNSLNIIEGEIEHFTNKYVL